MIGAMSLVNVGDGEAARGAAAARAATATDAMQARNIQPAFRDGLYARYRLFRLVSIGCCGGSVSTSNVGADSLFDSGSSTSSRRQMWHRYRAPGRGVASASR